ncbi:E3 ubiquitin-protein ligase RNF31, partial [Dissostichus eleginoides]
GVSSLSLLMSEMRQAFQKDTPLYARCPVQAPPPAADGNRPRPISPQRTLLFITPPHLSAQKGSQWEQSRKSYAEELQGIDFSCPAPSDPLSRGLEALSLDPQQVDSPVWTGQSGANIHTSGSVDLLPAAVDHIQMAAGLPPDQKITFLSLLKEGRGFRPADVFEAVQLSPDYPSALRFLTHCCPLCQEQVTFSKIISMTHCSCFLCESCFKAFFSSAIKEKSIDQLTCPQCGRPEVRGQGGGMEYFNLLDTQIRHFLPPQTHELFQRKLRDRALQEMPNFIWCSHCSFGILHEADRLKMDCPSCCSSVFSVSRGGCLHFTCSQCQHQFCGGCRQTFSPGAECLVQLINRCRGDPAVLFSVAEMGAELQRWGVAVPTRRAEEAEPEYTERLRTTLTNSVPLRKHL